MNVRAAKDEVSLLFPANISYAAPAMTAPRATAPRRGIVQAVSRALAWIAELPARRSVMFELETMSDRELADIGLARGELSKVFESNFVAARARSKSAPQRIAGAA